MYFFLIDLSKMSVNTTSADNTADIQDEQAEKDVAYNAAHVSLFLLSIGSVLPWNFFIYSDQYFKHRLRSNPKDQKLFESAFSVCSQIPNGIAVLSTVYLTDRMSRKGRLLGNLSIITLLFLLTAIMANIDTDSWTGTFYGITLSMIVVINFCSGLLLGTVLGIGGVLGKSYSYICSSGLSFAGMFASIANLISLAAVNNINMTATIYFCMAIACTVLCIIISIGFFRMDVYAEMIDCKIAPPAPPLDKKSLLKGIVVLEKIYPFAFSLMFTMMLSVIVMPSLLSGIVSVDSNTMLTSKYFIGIAGFLLFNTADFFGRLSPSLCHHSIIKNKKLIVILSLSRTIFVPMFMLCNYQPREHLTVVFDSDYYPIIFNLLFSLSGGYIVSVCIMLGPELVPDELAETTGVVMQVFIVLGMGLGAALSFFFVGII